LTAYAQFAVGPSPRSLTIDLIVHADCISDIRKQYSSQGLSFAEIAKRIGVDWQEMSDDIRDRYLTRAADEKQKYEMKLRIYQNTDAYRQYNQYLSNFKAKLSEKIKTENQ
jgi:predicted DNA-binding protein YlxM (UPF0122 family)